MRELKFDDTTQGIATATLTGTILQNTLLVIPEGVGEEQRIGRKINLTKLMFRGSIIIPASTDATSTSDVIRLIVYHDKQCNNTAATVTELLATASFDSFRNLAFTHRFRFLHDKCYTITSGGAGGNGTAIETCSAERNIQFYINLHNMPIIYNSSATTGALNTIESNNIGFMSISSNAEAGIVGKFRVRFYG